MNSVGLPWRCVRVSCRRDTAGELHFAPPPPAFSAQTSSGILRSCAGKSFSLTLFYTPPVIIETCTDFEKYNTAKHEVGKISIFLHTFLKFS
jgi:hypothetical protein